MADKTTQPWTAPLQGIRCPCGQPAKRLLKLKWGDLPTCTTDDEDRVAIEREVVRHIQRHIADLGDAGGR